MKLTALFLLCGSLSLSAAVSGQQQITLRKTDATLAQVLRELEKQSGKQFVYFDQDLAIAKRVTIDVRNLGLEQVLATLFKNQPLTYSVYEKNVVIKRAVPQAPPTTETPALPPAVHGRITNEKGEPVAGVSIALKGGKVVGVSNDNGEFTLNNIPDGATLVFSGVNIQTYETKLNGRTELAIAAKAKVVALEDVTIEANTGYQKVKPNEVTGAINVVTNQQINQQAGTNILKRLDGMAPAILFDTKRTTPTKKLGITVRGLSSISGPLDPLIVLDGFIYEGDINNINPNIVDNVTLLKDAAATSIWGARAGNGVIVITTKKGKFNQPLRVNVSSTVIVNSKPDLYYLPQMSSSDYINVEQFLYKNGAYNSQFTATTRPALSPAVEIFRKRSLGQITAADSSSQIDALKSIDIRDQFNRYFYSNPVTQQYTAGLTGGSANNAYSFVAAYDKSLNELSARYQKMNVKIDNQFRLLKNLTVNTSIYYTNSKNESGKPAYGSIVVAGTARPYTQFADDAGNALSVDIALRGLYTDTAGAGKLLNWKYYPLEDYKHNTTTTNLQELFASLALQYRVNDFLSADISYQYQRQQSSVVQWMDDQSFFARDLINRYTNLNQTSALLRNPVAIGGIRKESNRNIRSQTVRGQVNFNKTWGDHNVSAITGAEGREVYSNGDDFTIYGYNTDPFTSANTDFVNSYPLYLGGTAVIPGRANTTSDVFNRFISAYGNAVYTYRKRYNFSLSGRRDGANVFGANTNDRWKPLWSTGLGWRLSEEPFYHLAFLPELRLRATYGFSGNVDLTKTALPIATYSTTANPYTGYRYGNISVLNDPDLRWEKVGTINFGADFGLKRNIVFGSVDWYFKKSTDLFGPALYDYTTFGATQVITKNVASTEGHGLELSLHSNNLTGKISWRTDLYYSHQTNQTTNYYSTATNSDQLFLGAGSAIIPAVGRPLYAIVAYRWGGLDANGNPVGFVNGQRSIDYNAIAGEATTKGVGGNLVYMGSALPTDFGSLNNTISYKSFTLSVLLSYKFGFYFRRTAMSYSGLIAGGAGYSEFQDRWQKPGDELRTNVPSFIYPNPSTLRDDFYTAAEINVLKGDFIRLQNINLSYSIQREQWKHSPFGELRCFVSAANLGILWRANHYGLDPEYPSSIKPTSQLAVGINASF